MKGFKDYITKKEGSSAFPTEPVVFESKIFEYSNTNEGFPYV